MASIPAIQPVSNRDLDRIASGFGMRIDPVYGTAKMHKGLDFTAPQGTPIYATGNGTVEVAGQTGDGYGNHILINHGQLYHSEDIQQILQRFVNHRKCQTNGLLKMV